MRQPWQGAALAVAACLMVATALAETGSGVHVLWPFPALASPNDTPASTIRSLPGSNSRYTEAQIHDMFHAVDWRPGDKSVRPAIVSEGRAPGVMACGYCHLPSGQGRPENASLAGLPATYIVAQVAAMRTGLRTGARADWPPAVLMHKVAVNSTRAEVQAAAAWFASQHFVSRTRVVEARIAPGARQAAGVYRFDPTAPRLTLTSRIVEGPDDFDRFELRDDEVGYTAYVPEGAVSRGARLAAGDGRAESCSSCHGARLNGGLGPPIAGRSPTWLFRQLYAFKVGARREPNAAIMVQELASWGPKDLVDLAAYVASRRR